MKFVLIAAALLVGPQVSAETIKNVVGVPAAATEKTFAVSFDAKALLGDWISADARPYPGQPVPPPYYGSCFVANPGERDAIGRYCSTGYGIMFNGHILNGTCYYEIDAAFRAMQSARVCNEPIQYGACSITQPGQLDLGDRKCANGYGVLYNGYIVDNTCFFEADGALSKMHSTMACTQSPSYGRCTIMQHNQLDRNGRKCANSYGVAYDGVIMNNTCYFQIDAAIRQMLSSAACRAW